MLSNLPDRRVSPLRIRMIEDMTVRGFTEKTRQDYIRHVQAFAAFIGRSPATATPDDIRGFQLHQRQSGMQPPSITGLVDAHAAGRLAFFGEIEGLRRRTAFTAYLAPLRRKNWFVYAKPPFAGPEAVLADLARYTHRLAISNSRLLARDERGVTFRYKDYRRNGQARYRTMTLAPDAFIRRFLRHVLPKGSHRIRHYGLLASAGCKANIARARELITGPPPPPDPSAEDDNTDQTASTSTDHRPPCPCCGGRMIIVEIIERGGSPRGPPTDGPRVRTAAP